MTAVAVIAATAALPMVSLLHCGCYCCARLLRNMRNNKWVIAQHALLRNMRNKTIRVIMRNKRMGYCATYCAMTHGLLRNMRKLVML